MKRPQLEQAIEKKSRFTIKEIKLWMLGMNVQWKIVEAFVSGPQWAEWSWPFLSYILGSLDKSSNCE